MRMENKKSSTGTLIFTHSDCSGIPPLQKDGKSYTDSQEKAKILNDYFCTGFSHKSNNDCLALETLYFQALPQLSHRPRPL